MIIAVASLMRSLGAQLAMFSMATLANLMLEPFAPSLALPRRVGMSLLAALPELLIFLGVTWILLRYLHRKGDAAAFEAAWQVINRGVEAWAERLLRETAQQNA